MHGLIVTILIASGLGGPGAPKPFPQVPSNEVVVRADGAIVYNWPAVPTLFLLTTPLDEIDAWMEREAQRAAKLHKWARHDLVGECPQRDRWCICINGRMGPYPVDRMLNPEQWRMLVERVGREAERIGDLTHVRSLLDRLVMFRGWLERAQTPDLTPVLLAVIDGAARGDGTFLLHASKVHAWSDDNPGILNRELVRTRLDEVMQQVTTQEQALSVAVLASSLGLGDSVRETAMIQRVNAAVVPERSE